MSETRGQAIISTARLAMYDTMAFAMNHIVTTVVVTTLILFIVGSLAVSVPIGLLAGMVGSMGILYVYIGFCQSFADQRGRRQA